MAVLLVGSTGNGKSILGNFLLNPHENHILVRSKPSRQLKHHGSTTIIGPGRGPNTSINTITTNHFLVVNEQAACGGALQTLVFAATTATEVKLKHHTCSYKRYCNSGELTYHFGSKFQ